MFTDRLSHLQNLIQRHYEQLEGKENTLLTTGGEDRVRIEQQIEDFKKKIAKVESEYEDLKGGTQKNLSLNRGQESIPQRSKQLFGATNISQVKEWVGRAELLSELTQDFSNGRKVLILHGQGGIGKTSLAVKLMEACGVNLASEIIPQTCPYDNALYCGVSKDSYSLTDTFLTALGLAERRAGATAEQIIEMILTRFHQERWFVVIDNLETLLERGSCRAVSPDVGKLLYELAYGNHNSQIVITSRKVPADLEERRGNQIDTSIIRVESVGGISKSDSLLLLEGLRAGHNQVELDWIVDRVDGNPFALRLWATYSRDNPGKLRKQLESVTDEAIEIESVSKPIQEIVQLQLKAQSSAAQNLLKRMCVLRIGMDAKALTILRLFLPTKNPFSRKKAAQKQTEALLKALLNSALVEETYNSSTCESEYKLPRLIAETLQEIFPKERRQLWRYAAKLYDSFKPPQELRSLADWEFGLEKLYFWWQFDNRKLVIRIVINSLLPSLEPWSYWDLQKEWCDRILPYTKDTDYRYCLQTLGCICRDTGKLDEGEKYLQQSLDHAEQAGDRADMAISLTLLATIACKQGDDDRAEALCDRAEALFKPHSVLYINHGLKSPLVKLTSFNLWAVRTVVPTILLIGLLLVTMIAYCLQFWEDPSLKDLFNQDLKDPLNKFPSVPPKLVSLSDSVYSSTQSPSVFTKLVLLLEDLFSRRPVPSKLVSLSEYSSTNFQPVPPKLVSLSEDPSTQFQPVPPELNDWAGMETSGGSLDIPSEWGESDWSTAFDNQCPPVETELGNLAKTASYLMLQGAIARKQGDDDRAEAMYSQCVPFLAKLGKRGDLAYCLGVQGNIARNRGEYDLAEARYKQSLEVRTELGDRAGMASSWGCLGENELLRGNLATAETWLKQALTVFEELQMPDSLAEIHWDLARLERAKGDELQGQAHYAISHNLYSKLGATKNLERIEREWNAAR
jgi:tetratricopeptide (TPR) repeat protein